MKIKMTDSERKEFLDNFQEQFANSLLIIEYSDNTQFTKVWHERVNYLMENFTITKKTNKYEQSKI